MFKILFLASGVTVVGALGWAIDQQSRSPAQRDSVPTASPAHVCALGRLEGATPEVELRSRLAGRVVRVQVREGQSVRKGEVLFELDDRDYQEQVALAAAELSLAEAQLQRRVNGARREQRQEAAARYQAKQAELESAQLNWQRTRLLREEGAVSQQRADDQRTLVAALTAEVEAARTHAELLNAPARPDEILMDKARIRAAQARLELARVELDRTKVRAPSDGQILDVEVEPGELTGPDVAQPAVVITDTSRYRVRAFIEEMDAPRVRQGMSVRVVADGLPGRALEGRVAQCCPRMGRKQLWSDDPAERYDTKTREVWVDLDSREDLIIGLRVDVVIDTESAAPIPSVSPSPEDGRPRTPIHAVRNLACASADPH